MIMFFSTKNALFSHWSALPRQEKSQVFYSWPKTGTFQPKMEKLSFFSNNPSEFTILKRNIENWKSAQGVYFEIIASLKTNFTKYLLIFANSCAESWNPKALVDIVTAGGHRGLNTVNIEYKQFPQSECDWDAELQNTHSVLFKSLREVMQVNMLSAQLEIGSELVDWFWEATSVPFSHFLIDLPLQGEDRLLHSTNSGPVPSKFYIPTGWNMWSLWTINTQNLSILRSFQYFSSKKQKSFLSVLPEKFKRFLRECIVKLIKGNLQSLRRHHVKKFWKTFEWYL